MVTNELLIRTVHAARDARERGYNNTADAFEEIADNLLELLRSRSATPCDARAKAALELNAMHSS